jgi:hypothetical protein
MFRLKQLKSKYHDSKQEATGVKSPATVSEGKDSLFANMSSNRGSYHTSTENVHAPNERQEAQNTPLSCRQTGAKAGSASPGAPGTLLQQSDSNTQIVKCDSAASKSVDAQPDSLSEKLLASLTDLSYEEGRDIARAAASGEWGSEHLMSWLVTLLRRNNGTLCVEECDVAMSMAEVGARAALCKVGGWRSLCGRNSNKRLLLYRKGRISLRDYEASQQTMRPKIETPLEAAADERTRPALRDRPGNSESSACELTVAPPLNMLDLNPSRQVHSLPRGALAISEAPLPRQGAALPHRRNSSQVSGGKLKSAILILS